MVPTANAPNLNFRIKVRATELIIKDDNLFSVIDQNQCQLLNVTNSNGHKLILRPEDKKYQYDPKVHFLQSHSNDPEMIIVIRFKAEIKVRAVNIIAKEFALPNELNMYYIFLWFLIIFDIINDIIGKKIYLISGLISQFYFSKFNDTFCMQIKILF